MTNIEPHWKTEPWVWGGADLEALKKDMKYVHAIRVPGIGVFGGFPPDIAQYIVDCVNAQQKIASAIHDLMLPTPGFTPFLEGL